MSIDDNEREQAILDAAAELIIRQGYNKTTMSDVADVVGLSRPLLYVHFKSRDDLLEALIAREVQKYGALWIEYIEADPHGGTVASTYRGIVHALKHTPVMAAIVTRDENTFGKYLRKPGNLFNAMQTPAMTGDFLHAMQRAGVVRQDVDIAAMAYIMDLLSYGLVTRSDSTDDTQPPYAAILETMAEMLDRMLTPADGGNLEAGKAVLRQIADQARQQFFGEKESPQEEPKA